MSVAEVRPEELLDDWRSPPGFPFGGLPPFDRATPELIEAATHIAIARKRAAVASILADPAPATFDNTVVPYEAAGGDLRRIEALRVACASLRAVGSMPQVNQRLARVIAAFEDDMAHDAALFARIEAVHHRRATLDPEQARLTEVLREAMVRRGAGLAPDRLARLKVINGEISALQSRFQQNLIDEAVVTAVFVEDAAELDGLPDYYRESACALARARGRDTGWAIANTRVAVWQVLQFARHRELRRRVREMWMGRGAAEGSHDNRPVIAQIVRLRGEKAKLLGFPSFAHWATANRMARTPDVALQQLLSTWKPALRAACDKLAQLQALADADGLGGPLQAWDRLYYAEMHRRRYLALDSDAVKAHLELGHVLEALFHAAGRLHQLSFEPLHDVPVLHPDVRVFAVSKRGEPVGIVCFDLLAREGKMHGSWQAELQTAEDFRGRRLCFSNVCSGLARQSPDGPVLLPWEYANVLFHEFGHAMHMLLSRARYPSLGSMAVAWDAVEVPSQLNERWLLDRELLRRFARHHVTGEPMTDAMIDALEALAKSERVTSVGVDYLACAIVDMRMHLEADGGPVDPLAVERQVHAELGLPEAIDPIMRLPNQFHSFTDAYAAGLYVYLWADVMVADVLEAFMEAPGGLYDETVALRWRDQILTVGHRVPAATAFRNFRGRDPDPAALLRRFDLAD